MKRKITIMKTRPEVTDEEIQHFMDFDKLLQARNSARAAKGIAIKTKVFIGAVSIVTLVGVWLTVKYLNDRDVAVHSSATSVIPGEPKTNVPDSATVIPQPKSEAATTYDDKRDTRVEPKLSNGNSAESEQHKSARKDGTPIHKAETQKPVAAEPVYEQAEPVDGYPALYEYFNSRLVYPAEALKDSIQGIVTVVFAINKEGKPEKVSIENSLGPLFDREAIRLIENMPAWKPATYNAKPVSSKISLPITFSVRKK